MTNLEIADTISAFLAKHDECEPYVNSAIFIAYTNKGGNYTGPNYGLELTALRDLLDKLQNGGVVL